MLEKVKIHLLPGGMVPERQTEGAIGYDVAIRAIVCPHEKDRTNPNLRKVLFDFNSLPNDKSFSRQVAQKDGRFIYRLRPQESVLAGIGFITEMEFPLFYWVAPRSGLAAKHNITVTNAPGTVDPDYRGEAGVLVYNRDENKSFDLWQGMRIAQIIFQRAHIPEFSVIETADGLEATTRGSGGFGSTGLE